MYKNYNSRPNAIKIVRYNRRHVNFWKDLFHDYCSNTTLHGIHYLGANDKNWFEKLWWLLVFLLSLIVCVILINRTWMKWTDNPLIVSFNQEQVPIWKIPFPAVTICPINKIDRNHYDYTEKYRSRNKLTGEEHKKFWDVSLLCASGIFHVPSDSAKNITDEDVDDNIYDVSPKLEDVIDDVLWSNMKYSKNFFASQLTEEGICFTSNSLSQKDMFTDKLNHDIMYINHDKKSNGWTLEYGYPPDSDADTYPRRTSRNGFIGSLSVKLLAKMKDIDYMCGLATSGYKLLFHNPAEIAKPGQQYIFVPFDKQVTVTVRPEMITTSEELLTIPPQTRKCFFSNERKLNFFKTYTQDNCKMECLANMTLYFCECVPFYLPRGIDTPICGYGSLRCLGDMANAIFKYDISHDKSTAESKKFKTAFKLRDVCDCMLSCHSLQYLVDTSQSEWYIKNTIQALNEMKGGEIEDEVSKAIIDGNLTVTQVDIFFKDAQFLALERTELYGQTDFIADCGGLLGLFLGFSFLSLMEIIYYLTIRVWFKFKYRKIEQAKITFVHQ